MIKRKNQTHLNSLLWSIIDLALLRLRLLTDCFMFLNSLRGKISFTVITSHQAYWNRTFVTILKIFIFRSRLEADSCLDFRWHFGWWSRSNFCRDCRHLRASHYMTWLWRWWRSNADCFWCAFHWRWRKLWCHDDDNVKNVIRNRDEARERVVSIFLQDKLKIVSISTYLRWLRLQNSSDFSTCFHKLCWQMNAIKVISWKNCTSVDLHTLKERHQEAVKVKAIYLICSKWVSWRIWWNLLRKGKSSQRRNVADCDEKFVKDKHFKDRNYKFAFLLFCYQIFRNEKVHWTLHNFKCFW